MKTATKEQSASEIADKKIKSEYGKYVRTLDPTKSPMSFSEFEKGFGKMQAEREIANKISLSAEQKAMLTVLGFTIEEHTPENGPNKNKAGLYLVNDAAKVNGTGFLRIDKERLENTLKRLQMNVEAIQVALGLVKL